MRPRFIVDAGAPLAAVDDAGRSVPLGRYGVWETDDRGKPGVIAVGDDLGALQAEYGPALRVLALERAP